MRSNGKRFANVVIEDKIEALVWLLDGVTQPSQLIHVQPRIAIDPLGLRGVDAQSLEVGDLNEKMSRFLAERNNAVRRSAVDVHVKVEIERGEGARLHRAQYLGRFGLCMQRRRDEDSDATPACQAQHPSAKPVAHEEGR